MAAPLLAAAAGVGGVTLLHFVDPNVPGSYLTCPFLLVTGWYCPGCGSLRAIHALSYGDLAGAAVMNPALLVAVPYFLFTWFAWVGRTATGRPRTFGAPSWSIRLLAVLILIYGVLRNVPGFEVLGPVR